MMKQSTLILIPILWLAFALRVYGLPHTPPGLWYDEAYYAMDALWLLETGTHHLFFAGNNGREPLFIYLQAGFIYLFGATPFTPRLLSSFIGWLTIPLAYVWARRLLKHPHPDGIWRKKITPYLLTLALATSFWHLGLSRAGFRGVLLPLFTLLLFYTFWRGWQTQSWRWFVLSGVALGLSQYTYLAARILPLVLLAFTILWTLGLLRLTKSHPPTLRTLWLGLILTGITSAILFAPLGLLFYHQPSLFSARTGDVLFTPDSWGELATHLSQAARLFVDVGDPHWRHNLPARPLVGWLGVIGFLPGLWVCLTSWRHPAARFILSGLGVLFLPALLSTPPVHALRLSSLLPFYLLIYALGLTAVAVYIGRWAGPLQPTDSLRRWMPLTLIALILTAETALTTYDYFHRWANHPQTYIEYNAPLTDLVDDIIRQTESTALLIPFHLYVHPTTRYLLAPHFRETTDRTALQNQSGLIQHVRLRDRFRVLNVANIPETAAFVWLHRLPNGAGIAIVTRPADPATQAEFDSQPIHRTFVDRIGQPLADFRHISAAMARPLLERAAPEMRQIDLRWRGQVELRGYTVSPTVLHQPDQPLTLDLYWRSLTDLTFDQRLFLQIIDPTGQPLTQWEGVAFVEDMYRWRPDGGLLPTQHTLWLGADTPPGAYLIRLGFFDDATGERLPLVNRQAADQVQLGLFYVTESGRDPRPPQTPVEATFSDSIKLLGVSSPSHSPFTLRHASSEDVSLDVSLHWQALRPTDRPYTVFLQLLNPQNEVVAGWDSQPYQARYPTDLWSPGETLVDTFSIPLPADGLPAGEYRLITGFYHFETGQRLTLPDGRDFVTLLTVQQQ